MTYCIDCYYFDCTNGEACKYSGRIIKEEDSCHKCIRDDDIIQIYNLYEYRKRKIEID